MRIIDSYLIYLYLSQHRELPQTVKTTSAQYAQDALYHKLFSGMMVIKHGRQGKPKTRLLRCNDAVTRLYWSDPLSKGFSTRLPADAKSVHLREVAAVRKGTELDPASGSKNLCGTPILNRHATAETLPLCFSLILPSRTFDVQCFNENDFIFLYGNLSTHCNRFAVRGGNREQYDDASIITSSSYNRSKFSK